jgi:hypothetical protein
MSKAHHGMVADESKEIFKVSFKCFKCKFYGQTEENVASHYKLKHHGGFCCRRGEFLIQYFDNNPISVVLGNATYQVVDCLVESDEEEEQEQDDTLVLGTNVVGLDSDQEEIDRDNAEIDQDHIALDDQEGNADQDQEIADQVDAEIIDFDGDAESEAQEDQELVDLDQDDQGIADQDDQGIADQDEDQEDQDQYDFVQVAQNVDEESEAQDFVLALDHDQHDNVYDEHVEEDEEQVDQEEDEEFGGDTVGLGNHPKLTKRSSTQYRNFILW